MKAWPINSAFQFVAARIGGRSVFATSGARPADEHVNEAGLTLLRVLAGPQGFLLVRVRVARVVLFEAASVFKVFAADFSAPGARGEGRRAGLFGAARVRGALFAGAGRGAVFRLLIASLLFVRGLRGGRARRLRRSVLLRVRRVRLREGVGRRGGGGLLRGGVGLRRLAVLRGFVRDGRLRVCAAEREDAAEGEEGEQHDGEQGEQQVAAGGAGESRAGRARRHKRLRFAQGHDRVRAARLVRVEARRWEPDLRVVSYLFKVLRTLLHTRVASIRTEKLVRT